MQRVHQRLRLGRAITQSLRSSPRRRGGSSSATGQSEEKATTAPVVAQHLPAQAEQAACADGSDRFGRISAPTPAMGCSEAMTPAA
jgi:hypothetical protein